MIWELLELGHRRVGEAAPECLARRQNTPSAQRETRVARCRCSDVATMVATDDWHVWQRQHRVLGLRIAHSDVRVAAPHTGEVAAAGPDACGGRWHHPVTAHVSSKRHPHDVEVARHRVVVPTSAQAGVIDAHDWHVGIAPRRANPTYVEFDAPLRLLAGAAQRPRDLTPRHLQTQGLRFVDGHAAQAWTGAWKRHMNLPATGRARHIAAQSVFEPETDPVVRGAVPSTVERPGSHFAYLANPRLAPAMHFDTRAIHGRHGLDVNPEAGNVPTCCAGKRSTHTNTHRNTFPCAIRPSERRRRDSARRSLPSFRKGVDITLDFSLLACKQKLQLRCQN